MMQIISAEGGEGDRVGRHIRKAGLPV